MKEVGKGLSRGNLSEPARILNLTWLSINQNGICKQMHTKTIFFEEIYKEGKDNPTKFLSISNLQVN